MLLSGPKAGIGGLSPEAVRSATTAGGLVALFWWFRLYLLHTLDLVVSWARGLPACREKNEYLKGLYAPTHEEHCDEDLPVSGTMPPSLDGVYVRVGPNPYFQPNGNYHWFDGDGMTHAVRIKNGKASYGNRYIETHRLKTEKKAGFPIYDKIGDAAGAGYLVQMVLQSIKHKLGIIDVSKGAGRANTAMVFHAKRLLSLEEGDMPYALRMLCSGVVETLGRVDYGGKLKHSFTAHPKKDHVTGELFSFGYNVDKQPYANYTVIDPEGNITIDVPVHLPRPIMMHDCALTEAYFVFLDMPLCFEPERIVKNGTLPFHFDKSRPSRFGLMPRYAKSEDAIKWFELPAMVIFHTANAWQEGPHIVKLAACTFDEFELDIGSSHFKTSDHMPRLHLMTFNLKTGEASRKRVSPVVGDFPHFPQHLTGRKTRYAYLCTMPEESKAPGFFGVTKLDMTAGSEAGALAGQIDYPDGVQGGEAFFVAKDAVDGSQPDEDDGYLVCFLMEERTGKSQLAVFDAKTMDSKPLATVAIPHRVPAGFHGLHIKEAELRTQAP
jgi:carotenoid cleavage dioxygenase